MKRKELIKKYVDFFKSKGHEEIPNSSLVPENDPTVLFTTAGMHPLVPYLLGQKHPLGKRLCNVQKCIRTTDIDEVGDETHHTFFEMLGNWSLGDYWKQDAIKFTFEFYTKILKIPKEKLAVTVFAGNENIQRDEESAKVWLSLGIPKERIAYLNDNWWGPAGNKGPCGPDTEIFFWSGKKKAPKEFNPNDSTLATDGHLWVEIGNDVLMQYNKNEKGKFNLAKQKNIDFGGGVERTLAVLNGFGDNYLTEIWQPTIKEIEKLSKKKYKGNERTMRIIADHLKAVVFILAGGITPSNTERGYVLRRLIRRAIWYEKKIEIKESSSIIESIFEIYKEYPELKKNKKMILEEIKRESDKFNSTIKNAIKKFEHFTFDKPKQVNAKDMFLLFQSFGMPLELIKEELGRLGLPFPEEEFKTELKSHVIASGALITKGVFKSGLADNSEATTKLHTAAHLLLASLRQVLKDKNINQRGSNITPERLRLDFSFDRKLTDKEIKEIENLVNEKIKQSIPMIKEEMSLDKARKAGATGIFDEKYKDNVFVYTIKDFSKEICAGPHVSNTKELGHFKITKEESSSSGVRRIKAILN